MTSGDSRQLNFGHCVFFDVFDVFLAEVVTFSNRLDEVWST